MEAQVVAVCVVVRCVARHPRLSTITPIGGIVSDILRVLVDQYVIQGGPPVFEDVLSAEMHLAPFVCLWIARVLRYAHALILAGVLSTLLRTWVDSMYGVEVPSPFNMEMNLMATKLLFWATVSFYACRLGVVVWFQLRLGHIVSGYVVADWVDRVNEVAYAVELGLVGIQLYRSWSQMVNSLGLVTLGHIVKRKAS
jgi:hypothetical protein